MKMPAQRIRKPAHNTQKKKEAVPEHAKDWVIRAPGSAVALLRFKAQAGRRGFNFERAGTAVIKQLMRDKDLNARLSKETATVSSSRGRGLPLAQLDPRSGSGKLRYILKNNGISQRELARLAKMNPSFVSRAVRHLDRCRPSTVQRIARALGLDVEAITADGVAR